MKRGPKTGSKSTIPLRQRWDSGARGLTDAARRHYHRTVELLTQRGVLDSTDVELVRTLAMNLELRDVAYEQLKLDGPFLTSDRGNVSPHPAEKMIGSATMRITRLESELGLTPASARNATPGQRGASGLYGQFAAYLGGTGG